MNDRLHLAPYILLALALVGMGDAGYLSYFHYINAVPSCAIKGCEVVLASPYAKIFGVPWSYLGLVYYTYLLGLALMLAVDPKSPALKLGALAYTGVGVLYSCYAVFYVQLTIIHAICQYCVLSALVTLGALCVAVWHWRKS